MRKGILLALLLIATTAASAPVFLPAKFDPSEESMPIDPDEAAVELASKGEWAVYRLASMVDQCTGLVVANLRTKTFQRLRDISCDDGVTNANILPTKRSGVYAIDFYNESELIGRLTVKR
jgi:hypothetical protein